MSIPNLPVNFKDDILAASNPKRKYQQTFNSDGSVSLEDVTVYTQQGSDFGASQVNQTNRAINNIYSERILTLEELELVTEPGFFVDAQAAKESYEELNSKILYEVISVKKSFPTGRTYFDMGPITIPSGYKCVGLSVTHIRADWIQCSATLKDNSTVNVVAYNYFTSAITSDISITVTYARD